MGEKGLNGPASNIAMSLVVVVTVLLGALNVSKAVASAVGLAPPTESRLLQSAGVLALVLAWPLGCAVRARRRGSE